MINCDAQIEVKPMESYIHDCRLNTGQTIRKMREKRGYSQEQLSVIMKVSRTTISKIENGKFNCSMDYLSKFSWFLDFDFLLVDNKS